METKSIAALLGDNPLFATMSVEHRELLAGCASNMRFEEDSLLVHEGDPAEKFYVLRQGRVAIEIHAPQRDGFVIQTVEEGDVVGFSALFPPYRWTFDARATQTTRAFAFDARCLRQKFNEDPTLGLDLSSRFAQVMLKRMHAMRIQLMDVYGDPQT